MRLALYPLAEAKRLSKDSYQTKLAKAIYSGISDYFLENQPLDAIAPIPVSEVPSEYIVSKGDTLSEIAARGGVDLDRLIDFNNLKNSNIFVGQKIRFPSEGMKSNLHRICHQNIRFRGVIPYLK